MIRLEGDAGVHWRAATAQRLLTLAMLASLAGCGGNGGLTPRRDGGGPGSDSGGPVADLHGVPY